MIAQLVISYIIFMLKEDKLTSIDLSKQQSPDPDPKAIQQIKITGNLEREGNGNTITFFMIEEADKNFLDFAQGNVKAL